MRNTASLSEVIQPDADPLTPSAQLVALPTATTAAVVPGVASNLLAAFNMTTTSDNDAAPTPNHSLIASLLPTIRPPAALLEPDGPLALYLRSECEGHHCLIRLGWQPELRTVRLLSTGTFSAL